MSARTTFASAQDRRNITTSTKLRHRPQFATPAAPTVQPQFRAWRRLCPPSSTKWAAAQFAECQKIRSADGLRTAMTFTQRGIDLPSRPGRKAPNSLLKRALSSRRPTAKRDYIQPLSVFYSDPTSSTTIRADAYARRWQAPHERSPNDRESAFFYASSAFASGPDRTPISTRHSRRSAILNRSTRAPKSSGHRRHYSSTALTILRWPSWPSRSPQI